MGGHRPGYLKGPHNAVREAERYIPSSLPQQGRGEGALPGTCLCSNCAGDWTRLSSALSCYHAADWARGQVDSSAQASHPLPCPLGRVQSLRCASFSTENRFAGFSVESYSPPGNPGPACGGPWALPIRSGVCRSYAPALRASYYQASSPLFSGSTNSRALMPTSIIESSGSKVVKFWSHRPGATKIRVTNPSCRPAQRLNS